MEAKEILEIAKCAKDGKIAIEIREGKAKEILPEIAELEITPLEISGEVSTVYNFINSRGQLYDPEKCHIVVTKKKGLIAFIGNEQRESNKHRTIAKGSVEKSSEVVNLPLDRDMTPMEFSRFVRRNKKMFPSSEKWLEIFKSYSNFRAQVQQEKANMKDQSGNSENVAIQKVTHNLIQEFEINIPLIQGGFPEKIDIEIDIAPDLTISLFAPDLDSKFEKEVEKAIDVELEKDLQEGKLKDFCLIYYK